MTQTWWLSFADRNQPDGDQFLGVVVIDVDEADLARSAGVTNALRQQHHLPPLTDPDTLMLAAAVWKTHRLGCNPGGEVASVRIDDLPGFAEKSARWPRGRLLSRADIAGIERGIPLPRES